MRGAEVPLALEQRDPEFIRRCMPLWQWFHRHYFRVRTSGWEQIPASGQLMFVGSHNGGLATPDLPMFMVDWFRRFGYDRRVYGLAHAKVWQAYPLMADLAARTGAIPFHPRLAMAALEQGDSLLLYPGGGQDAFRPHRDRGRIQFMGRTGFLRLAIWHGVPLVPLVSWGSHDTLVVLADLYPQAKALHRLGMPWLLGLDPEVMPLYLGLPWGLALGPLPNIPLPVTMHTRVLAPIQFERSGHTASRDKAYVRSCYELVVGRMQTALDDLAKESSPGGW